MISQLGQIFRKTSGVSPPGPAVNEDLESGHRSSVLQESAASGYPSSPSRVYLPISQFQHSGQNELTTQVPSGPSRVVGYLPRTLCSAPSPLVAETRFLRSPSPRSPFNPGKHGQALRRLETHGSLKTIPSGQQEGGTLNSTSISFSELGREILGEDHAAVFRGSPPQQPESGFQVDPNKIADQHSETDLSSPETQYLPNSFYQPAVLSQGDSSKFDNPPDTLKTEDGRSLRKALPSFVFPLPNMEADNSDQVTPQALYPSQAPPKLHKAPPSRLVSEDPIAADASLDTQLRNLSSEGMPENDAVKSIVQNHDTQRSEQLEDMAAYEQEWGDDQQRPIGTSNPESDHPAHTFVPSPIFEKIDQYLWSPAPSDDGQETLSAPLTLVPRHAPSDTSHASPSSGLTSDSHGRFSRSLESFGNEHVPSQSSSPGNLRVNDSPLPHIDVLIPAGNIDLNAHPDFLSPSQRTSTMGSRGSSSVLFRYSGVITDGASSRPMSEVELKEEVLHSLGDRETTGLSILSSRDSSTQADLHTNSKQIRGDHDSETRPGASQLNRMQNPSTDTGPGSSQTSSSLSIDRYGGDLSGHKAGLGFRGLPPSRIRCPTPPLLFGKHAIVEPEKADTASIPAPGSTLGRFDQHSKVIRPKETGLLPMASCSLGEQDWETVSAKTEANTNPFDGVAFETKAGSSLADNSDSGNLSLSKETPYPLSVNQARPVMQHPAHPRHNHSFMLLKNSQTGDLVQVPQYEYSCAGRLPNNNASSPLVPGIRADSTYQHPSPLRIQHNHPFISSPPMVCFTKPSATSIEDRRVVMQQNHLDSDSSSMGLSERVQQVNEKQTQNSLYKTTLDVSRVRDVARNQDRPIMDPKVQSYQSSDWLSTVSEVVSSEPSLPENGGTCIEMIDWNAKGHVKGTPNRGGNREVGSSLADASSPGANFSSSPAPPASSPIQFSNTPPSLGQGLNFNKQAVRDNLDCGNQHLLGDFHKSLARSFNREDSETSAISATNSEDRSRSHSASGPRMEYRKPSPRRRRSSSESHSGLMDSSSAHRASALNSSSSDGHAQQTTSSRLLLRNPFLHLDDNDSQHDPSQHNIIERRGRQPRADDTSVNDPTTPSSAESRPFVRDGVVHTDTPPPIFVHPVYGLDRPWDRIRSGPSRPRAHRDPLGRPLFQRPIARAESPHLYRVPHQPTAELLERHVSLSRIYLILSMMIPPVALIYGHGYMDAVMQFHTAGEISGFRNIEKTVALCWGYGMSAVCMLVMVITMIIISASG